MTNALKRMCRLELNRIIRLILHIENALDCINGSEMIWRFSVLESFEVNHDQLSGPRGLVPKQFSPSPVVTFVMSGSIDVIAETTAVSAWQ